MKKLLWPIWIGGNGLECAECREHFDSIDTYIRHVMKRRYADKSHADCATYEIRNHKVWEKLRQ